MRRVANRSSRPTTIYHLPFTIYHSLFPGFFLGGAEQRELAGARHLRDLLNFHLGDLVGVDARDADALRVHGPHDAEGVPFGLAEDLHEDFDDELHRREVVVVQQDAVERRLLQPLPALCGDLLLEPVLALRHGTSLEGTGEKAKAGRGAALTPRRPEVPQGVLSAPKGGR